MKMDQVISLLGPPLTQGTQQWSEVWSYWPAGTAPNGKRAKDGATTYSLFGKVTHFRFTQSGTVAAVSGDYLDGDFVGATKEQIQARLGQPSQLEVKKFEIIFYYTAPGQSGSGTYKKRKVHFDASSNVCSVVATMYYD
jgi:hypothetical protein